MNIAIMKYCRLLLLILLPGLLSAQGYRLRLRKAGDNRLAVEMRTVDGRSPAPEDRILDVVFGIKWTGGDAAVLGNQVVSRFNVRKAGDPGAGDGVSYQAFCVSPVGFGFPAAVANGPWLEIMTVGIGLSAGDSVVFELCEPGFAVTADPNVRVNSSDFTPVLEGRAVWSRTAAAVPVVAETGFRIRPNPANSFVQLSFPGKQEEQTLHYTILDGKGSTVKTGYFACSPGTILSMDVGMLSAGLYYVVVDRQEEVLYREGFRKL